MKASSRGMQQAFAYRLAGSLTSLALFALMLLVAIDVGGRYLFNSPVPGGYELVQLAMGVLVFSALPLVCRSNDHISLGLIDGRLGPRFDRLRRVFVHAFSALAMAFVGWRLFVHTGKLIRNGDATAVLGVSLVPIGVFMTAMTIASVASLGWLAWRSARDERATESDRS